MKSEIDAGGRGFTNARHCRLAALLLVAVFTQACGQHAATQDPPKAKAAAPSQLPNDTARFLAGLKGRPDGPYSKLEETAPWQKYAKDFDGIWAGIENGQFKKVDEFQQRELAGTKTNSSFVFYPLSGPDVLYANRFFPNAKVFVFAGLEPVGNLRPPSSYTPETMDRETRHWRLGVSSIIERSFFVTSEMDHQFRGEVFDGLLPMILLLLSRSGHTIVDVQYHKLTDDGKLEPEDPGTPPKKHQSVEVQFRRGEDPTVRTVYYFSRDLAAGFEKNPAFARFLTSLGTPDTLVKSGSFLLHWQMCNALRKYILENSNMVLQDDTGVPYAYFTKGGWDIRLFGQYSRPDKPFTNHYQKDLAAAFEDPARVRKLGFPLGYGAKRRPSSMILAMRPVKVAAAPAPAKN